MRRQKTLFRPGVVIVTFKNNYTREMAGMLCTACGIRINRWFKDSMTAEILVPRGRERKWLEKVQKIPGVQGASLDLHL